MKLRIVQLTLISILACSCVTNLSAQSSDSVSIVKKFDQLVLQWDLLSLELGKYEGLDKYCTDKPYQDNVIKTLEEIHHYDTLLYQTLAKKARYDKSSELKKTLKQMEADLNRYVEHITKLMDHIEEHIHHLHLE